MVSAWSLILGGWDYVDIVHYIFCGDVQVDVGITVQLMYSQISNVLAYIPCIRSQIINISETHLPILRTKPQVGVRAKSRGLFWFHEVCNKQCLAIH